MMLADRLAEGLAHLGIAHRIVEPGLCEAEAARGDVDPPELEPGHDLGKSMALGAADQAIGRYPKFLEEHLGGIAAVVAELLQLAPDPKARPLLGEEHGQAGVARLGIRIGLDQEGKAR